MRTSTLLILLLLLGMIFIDVSATPLTHINGDSTKQVLDLDEDEEDEEDNEEGGVLGGSLDMITLALYAALLVAIIASVAPYMVRRLRSRK